MKPQARQSTLDIAIQQCGSIEAVFDLATLNDISITDDLITENLLLTPEPENNIIASYYSNNGITPATAVTLKEEETTPVGGISFMGIEIDFKVS